MIKELKKLSKYNFKSILKFEIIFKVLTILIFSPLFLGLFNFIMKITGYTYLTKENAVSFLLNPITLVMLLILFILLTMYSLFDLGVIITLIDNSYQEKEVKLKDAVCYSLKRSSQVFRPKNLMIIFLVIFLIPFLNIGIGANFISSIHVPEFIMDYIVSNKTLLALYVLLIIALISIFLKWIYSLHYYFIENCTFKEACKKSKNLSKNSNIKDLLKITFTQILLGIIYALSIILEVFIIIILGKIFKNISFISSFLITIICVVIAISFVVHSVLATAISYTILSIMFYRHKNEKEENIKHIDLPEYTKKDARKIIKVFYDVGIVAVLILLTIATNLVMRGKINLNIEYVKNMEITAHRGASVAYPENTMSAFIGAKEQGADWIELDVQQTKDKKIIVTHDSNFLRTAGVDLNTWEATYDEVEKLDVGSWKDEKFKGEKVPLLETVVEWAKANNMRLNIELKPTGHEVDFEKDVVDIIKNNNFENSCVITSQVYSVLENVKNTDENITTVYVTALAYGDISRLDKADYFSIEASSVTGTMVSKIHNEGKQLYAWTVNTDEGINEMIEQNVDNIITDNVVLAKNLLYSSKTSNVISELIKAVDKLF